MNKKSTISGPFSGFPARLSFYKKKLLKFEVHLFLTFLKYQAPIQVSMGGGYSEDIKVIVDAHCNTFRVATSLYT